MGPHGPHGAICTNCADLVHCHRNSDLVHCHRNSCHRNSKLVGIDRWRAVSAMIPRASSIVALHAFNVATSASRESHGAETHEGRPCTEARDAPAAASWELDEMFRILSRRKPLRVGFAECTLAKRFHRNLRRMRPCQW
jgi:hypothetical protein